MELAYEEGQPIRQFLIDNRQVFEDQLLTEAKTVRDKIEEIQLIGNINLLENAHKLVLFVVDEKQDEVVNFARQEGIVWAKHSLTLALKIEWIQAIRRTLWDFLYQYDKFNEKVSSREEFYYMESRINDLIDKFLNGFFINYSSFKDKLIEDQRKLVENLSAPIIPITSKISILPIIGTMDRYRATIIEEKVLLEIGQRHVQKLIMDFSGIAEMETEVMQLFLKLLDGISMMGCEAVITGLRPDIVRNMVDLEVEFGQHFETKGSLQQALDGYLHSDDKILN
ncbi:Anti-anti-sigma regulatory factor (antagonist of anti-sigma factor) [Virgibacillus subterraneus]|uniref:Anti-anti-sigma regulatory factor (Antagonist of anti-sigma factor) n=1 Tax=Virgibacillus subterraneus TaxID=621109 RepID=A0A1H9H4C6_9BACI|nr:STAS domain-containing protein [Virgibacillus subterraneus]SEQ57180.1 Anti-anti-sigma regulatory factor (antagonist of anti-sigma factor) [Virgibacillus subterraneus]